MSTSYDRPYKPRDKERPSREKREDKGFAPKKKKCCPLSAAGIKEVDYKDVDLLRQFITERGKLLPRRVTGASHYYQKKVRNAILRSRYMALLPFVAID